MPVRTKAVLRTRLASMFADNEEGDITPEFGRDVFGDLIDSLLDDAGVDRWVWHHSFPWH